MILARFADDINSDFASMARPKTRLRAGSRRPGGGSCCFYEFEQTAPFILVEPVQDDLPSDYGLTNEILHFSACCREGKEPLSSGRDNLETTGAIFALYESARQEGKPIDLASI